MRKLKNSELDRLSVDEYKEVAKTPITVVLDNIRSCNNIGSVFRTSDALLIEKVIVTPHNLEVRFRPNGLDMLAREVKPTTTEEVTA